MNHFYQVSKYKEPMTCRILFSSKYEEEHVQISYNDTSIHRNQDVLDYIKKQWNETIKQQPSMFAGNLVSVQKNNSDYKYIRLDTIHTTYDDFYITKTKDFQKIFPNEINSNPLSVGCILVTNDNYLVFGIRNNKLAMAPGKTTVVSGMVDDSDIIDMKSVDLFGCIRREIEEEIGVKSNEIHDLLCIGLVDNLDQLHTYIPFFGRIDISFAKINERENDGELTEILKIENSEKMVVETLENNSNLSDVTGPTLQIYQKLFSILNSK